MILSILRGKTSSELDKSYIIKAGVEEIVVDNECAEPLNRAIYGVIEALVYLTRKDKDKRETEKLTTSG